MILLGISFSDRLTDFFGGGIKLKIFEIFHIYSPVIVLQKLFYRTLNLSIHVVHINIEQ